MFHTQRPLNVASDLPQALAMADVSGLNIPHVADWPYRFSSWAVMDVKNTQVWLDATAQIVAWAVMQTPFWAIDCVVAQESSSALYRAVLSWAKSRATDLLACGEGRPIWFLAIDAARGQQCRELEEAEQQRTFVAHLRDVHSWYKHLPLLRGGTFVVFVAPDAGQDYPTLHPSLPYRITVTGYHRAFGYLSYMWSSDGTHFSRDDGTHFSRDGENPLRLPSTLMEHCQFVLYPYVSNEFYWQVHQADVALLRAGTPHPERRRLLAWEATAQALERAEDTGVKADLLLTHFADGF